MDLHTTPAVWDPPSSLIDADNLQGVPNPGIGRGFKVGKEELVGLIYALEEFSKEDNEEMQATWDDRAHQVATGLGESDLLETRVVNAEEPDIVSIVFATLDQDEAGMSTATLLVKLRRETPRVFAGSDHLDDEAFTVNPMLITDAQATYVADRIRAVLGD